MGDELVRNIILRTLLWGAAAFQVLPIYMSFMIYFSFPRVKDWSAAWIVFIGAMVSIGFRRALVAATLDVSDIDVSLSWIFDELVMTYLHTILFWYFVRLKRRFFLKWFLENGK